MSKAADNLNALKATINAIPEFADRNVSALSERDFFDKIKGGTPPMIGIMYEGIRARATANSQPTHNVGLFGDIAVVLILAMPDKAMFGVPTLDAATTYLDALRNTLKDTNAVSGHKWRFVMEAPALEKDGMVLWIQRWSAPIPLT